MITRSSDGFGSQLDMAASDQTKRFTLCSKEYLALIAAVFLMVAFFYACFFAQTTPPIKLNFLGSTNTGSSSVAMFSVSNASSKPVLLSGDGSLPDYSLFYTRPPYISANGTIITETTNLHRALLPTQIPFGPGSNLNFSVPLPARYTGLVVSVNCFPEKTKLQLLVENIELLMKQKTSPQYSIDVEMKQPFK
jgi:hypothetical protein